MERRQIGLTNRSEALPLDDLRWIKTQGFNSFNDIPRMARWYRPDGTSSIGHADLYHLHLYRLRGFTLKPQIKEVIPLATKTTSKRSKPLVVTLLLLALEGNIPWEGTASNLCDLMQYRTPDSLGKTLFTPKVSESLSSEGLYGRVVREC